MSCAFPASFISRQESKERRGFSEKLVEDNDVL